MSHLSHKGPQWALDVHRDYERVSTIDDTETVPDPAWQFTDSRCHEHVFVHPDNKWPTLRWVVDPSLFYDDGDGYVDEIPNGHWECRECGETIQPGMKEVMAKPLYISHGVRASLKVGDRTWELSDLEAQELRNAMASDPETAIADFASSRDADGMVSQ